MVRSGACSEPVGEQFFVCCSGVAANAGKPDFIMLPCCAQVLLEIASPTPTRKMSTIAFLVLPPCQRKRGHFCRSRTPVSRRRSNYQSVCATGQHCQLTLQTRTLPGRTSIQGRVCHSCTALFVAACGWGDPRRLEVASRKRCGAPARFHGMSRQLAFHTGVRGHRPV